MSQGLAAVAPLLLAALVALGVATIGLARLGSGKQRRATGRLARVAAAGRGGTPPAAPARRAAGRRLRARAAVFLGLSWELAPFYPMRWWLVPPVALGAARVAGGIAEALLGPGALWLVPGLAWLLCRWWYARFHAAHRERLFRQMPDALGMVVRAVGIGVPPTEAIRTVSREALEPTATEFRRIAERLAIGTPLDRALAETAARNGVAEYRMFATALSLQSRTGGGLRESLETLAAVIRRRVSIRERAWALAAEVRLSIAILASLPFVSGGFLAVVNPEYVALLFLDPGGQQILAVAAGLLLLGVAIMRGMIRNSLT